VRVSKSSAERLTQFSASPNINDVQLEDGRMMSGGKPVFDFAPQLITWRESIQIYTPALTPEISSALVTFHNAFSSLEFSLSAFEGYCSRITGVSGMIEDVIETEVEEEARQLAKALVALADSVDKGRDIVLDGKSEEDFVDGIARETVKTFGAIIRTVLTARGMEDKIPNFYR